MKSSTLIQSGVDAASRIWTGIINIGISRIWILLFAVAVILMLLFRYLLKRK